MLIYRSKQATEDDHDSHKEVYINILCDRTSACCTQLPTRKVRLFIGKGAAAELGVF
jgi:hypothetical protein